MIDRGLYDPRREFEEFSHWEISRKPPWANPVVNLRKVLYQIECSRNSDEKLLIAANIALLFGPRWTLPVAASLGALLPPPENIAIIRAFRAKLFTDDDRENSCPLKTKVRAYDTLPEVEQFNKIMRDIYKDFCVKKLRHHVVLSCIK
ncbi:hypothetical protein BKA61DRAFT_679393 [Leptodontidium sp. MPI-SDFR-AT-0119]|nr:hypothetical protein BKA61DRAFT_679393 [Leptodontidium sp. MPI-SDFR-AT-0119]